jgi:hypothetical protein
MDCVSFVAFTREGKIAETLRFSLKEFGVGRKLINKMVPISLEKSLGLRKVVHLRKNQVTSQQGKRQW